MEMCLFSFHQSCQTRCAVEASVSESQLLLSLYHESCKVDFDCQFLISILCSYTVRMAQKKRSMEHDMSPSEKKSFTRFTSPSPPLPCLCLLVFGYLKQCSRLMLSRHSWNSPILHNTKVVVPYELHERVYHALQKASTTCRSTANPDQQRGTVIE